MPDISPVQVSLLQGSPEDMEALQRVFEGAPRYANNVTGLPPGSADAQSTYSILPEGKNYDDKFVYGIYAGDQMVGCIDLIRGYPDDRTAFLGLLLLMESHQGKGLGSAAYQTIEREVQTWGTCSKIRLAVVRTNDVRKFWVSQDFVETGEVKPYKYANLESETVLMEKMLDADC